jgi:hypothetical protein
MRVGDRVHPSVEINGVVSYEENLKSGGYIAVEFYDSDGSFG